MANGRMLQINSKQKLQPQGSGDVGVVTLACEYLSHLLLQERPWVDGGGKVGAGKDVETVLDVRGKRVVDLSCG